MNVAVNKGNITFLQPIKKFVHAGEATMMSSILFAVQSTVAKTGTEWNWSGTPVIIGACVLSLLIIPRIVSLPQVGQKMTLPFPEVFNNPSVGTFLASMSVGHLIGIPAVLGLTNLGVL